MKNPAFGLSANDYAAKYQAQIIKAIAESPLSELSLYHIGNALGFHPGMYLGALIEHGIVQETDTVGPTPWFRIDPDFNTYAFLEACNVWMAQVEEDAKARMAEHVRMVADGEWNLF